jgi:hypothetical protein
MATAKQEIRQALNKVDITGVVKEHKLGSGKGDNGNYINGSLVVKAGEFTEITVKVFVSELTSKNKVKKSYETLQKILKGEAKTMTEVSEEDAVKVRIWGKDDFTPKFKEEMFKPENSAELVTKIDVDLGFGNITIGDKITQDDYEAKFDVEMFVETIEEELDKATQEETGRIIVKGWTPVYGGSVIPLEIKVGTVIDDDGEEFDFAEEIRSSVDPEMTMNFWGDIDFKAIVEKTSKGGSLGKAKVDKKTTYIHDLVAIGAEFVEGENEYDIEDIKQARIERENNKQEALNKADGDNKSSGNKGGGIASRRGGANGARPSARGASASRPATTKTTTTKATTKPTTNTEEDDDELPF